MRLPDITLLVWDKDFHFHFYKCKSYSPFHGMMSQNVKHDHRAPDKKGY